MEIPWGALYTTFWLALYAFLALFVLAVCLRLGIYLCSACVVLYVMSDFACSSERGEEYHKMCTYTTGGWVLISVSGVLLVMYEIHQLRKQEKRAAEAHASTTADTAHHLSQEHDRIRRVREEEDEYLRQQQIIDQREKEAQQQQKEEQQQKLAQEKESEQRLKVNSERKKREEAEQRRRSEQEAVDAHAQKVLRLAQEKLEKEEKQTIAREHERRRKEEERIEKARLEEQSRIAQEHLKKLRQLEAEERKADAVRKMNEQVLVFTRFIEALKFDFSQLQLTTDEKKHLQTLAVSFRKELATSLQKNKADPEFVSATECEKLLDSSRNEGSNTLSLSSARTLLMLNNEDLNNSSPDFLVECVLQQENGVSSSDPLKIRSDLFAFLKFNGLYKSNFQVDHFLTSVNARISSSSSHLSPGSFSGRQQQHDPMSERFKGLLTKKLIEFQTQMLGLWDRVTSNRRMPDGKSKWIPFLKAASKDFRYEMVRRTAGRGNQRFVAFKKVLLRRDLWETQFDFEIQLDSWLCFYHSDLLVEEQPVRMYLTDFDNSYQSDPVYMSNNDVFALLQFDGVEANFKGVQVNYYGC